MHTCRKVPTSEREREINEAIRRFQITGIVFISVGAVILIKYWGYSDFVDIWMFAVPVLMIVVGVVVFITSFFGCCGAVKENHCMIITVSQAEFAWIDASCSASVIFSLFFARLLCPCRFMIVAPLSLILWVFYLYFFSVLLLRSRQFRDNVMYKDYVLLIT